MGDPSRDARNRAVRLIRKLLATDAPDRTGLLRDLAAALVDLRTAILTETGEPDWTGRTWEYRNSVNEIYRDAGATDPQARTALQAAVRYHVGERVREIAPAALLDEQGLRSYGPVERARHARAARSAIVAAASVRSDADVLRILAEAATAVGQIKLKDVLALSPKDREQVTQLAERLAAACARVVAAV